MSTSDQRNIVITAALPYANGSIHLGHMVEHTMVDFWTRFQKMRGHNCTLICADDTHGTPIMINAKKQGITPEQLIAKSKKEHLEDFSAFGIAYDNYSSTNDEANRELANTIYTHLRDNGHIEQKEIEQYYCEHDKMFLPDRYVKGTCPKCKAEDQYGDGCEVCGAVYDAAELIKPSCTICGNLPVLKNTSHAFLNLENFRSFLEPWVKDHTAPEVAKKLQEWLGDKLQSGCISRDAPYFGFEVPGLKDKFYYVWFDAPVGYISSFKEYCDRNGKNYKEEWDKAEIYHCIGKDIVYHHALFWPSMLKGSGFNTPKEILVHGMLKVNGTKMSKSRGTFVQAATYIKHLQADYLRYYLACKMTSGIEDLDLNWDDFCARVNSDLIGKITNVASRGAQMLAKLDSKMTKLDDEGKTLVELAQSKSELIAEFYEERNFSKAMLEIRSIADEANKYFDKYEPWKLVKVDEEKTKVVLTTILNMFRTMAVYLKPVLPD